MTIYEAGASILADVYTSISIGYKVVDSVVIPDTDGNVVFWVDGDKYPTTSYFDIKVSQLGYADTWLYGVWSFFVAATAVLMPVVVSGSNWTRVNQLS